MYFLRAGHFAASARPIPILGVKARESWKQVGVTFAALTFLATGAFLYFSRSFAVGPEALAIAVLIALPLSLSNAFVEEIITRWVIAEGMTGAPARYAPAVSALIFGSVHYFGIPGGPVGMLMAGFLGWLLTRSIQDTGGIGWAIAIHFVLDVLIFTVELDPVSGPR